MPRKIPLAPHPSVACDFQEILTLQQSIGLTGMRAQGPLAEDESFAHRLMSCWNDIGGCYQELRNFDEATAL